MRIALGQLNPTIGDIAGNAARAQDALARAAAAGADLLVLSELFVTGYPARDLLEREGFVTAAERALTGLVAHTAGTKTALLIGHPRRRAAAEGPGRPLANTASLIADGRVLSAHDKSLLPTYDVFDEDRYFQPAGETALASLGGVRFGVTICEDAWNDAGFWPERRYRQDPVESAAQQGAAFIINLAASPFTLGKRPLRARMLAAAAQRHRRPLLFLNQVGGHDDLVFDGASLVFDAQGTLVARGAEFAEDLLVVDVADGTISCERTPTAIASDERAVLDALVLGLRDYARRCGFRRVILGLSGGIDSAVVACVAARALGPENVRAVALPSRYSTPSSVTDAAALATALGISFEEISIEPAFAAYLASLAPAFTGRSPDVTEENIQARVRGTLLMALANKFGALLLTTGNKSEVATGYCTLYGDMAGGFAPLSDVPKTLVYRIAAAINAERALIPTSTMTKAPSAELRPDQKDEDSLPPYDVLDPLIAAHVDRGLDRAALIAEGFAPALVDHVTRLVWLSEHKRKQMPPGIKITDKAFGTGRRIPIAQSFRG